LHAVVRTAVRPRIEPKVHRLMEDLLFWRVGF